MIACYYLQTHSKSIATFTLYKLPVLCASLALWTLCLAQYSPHLVPIGPGPHATLHPTLLAIYSASALLLLCTQAAVYRWAFPFTTILSQILLHTFGPRGGGGGDPGIEGFVLCQFVWILSIPLVLVSSRYAVLIQLAMMSAYNLYTIGFLPCGG